MTPDELLAGHTPAVREVAETLRRLLHATAEFRERAYPGWHGIGFHHPRAGYVAGIFPRDEDVRLLFEHGRELADPDGVFQGGGTQTRHLDLRPGDTVPAAALERLLLEAVALRLSS